MTYLKLGKLREAERDATKSLQSLPAGNPKALFRRGLARKGLGKLDLARQGWHILHSSTIFHHTNGRFVNALRLPCCSKRRTLECCCEGRASFSAQGK